MPEEGGGAQRVLASLGTFGLDLPEVEARLGAIRSALPGGEPFAVNVFSNFADPDGEPNSSPGAIGVSPTSHASCLMKLAKAFRRDCARWRA